MLTDFTVACTSLGLNEFTDQGWGKIDDIFKCIFLNGNLLISLEISLKFVPGIRINNIPALVHIMAGRRPGDKPLFEPMMVTLLMHVFITQPQQVND